MSGQILTRDEFEKAIPRHFIEARRRLLEYLLALDAESYAILALRRFDDGAELYGTLYLDTKDWPEESDEEAIDGLSYHLFDVVYEERNP